MTRQWSGVPEVDRALRGIYDALLDGAAVERVALQAVAREAKRSGGAVQVDPTNILNFESIFARILRIGGSIKSVDWDGTIDSYNEITAFATAPGLALTGAGHMEVLGLVGSDENYIRFNETVQQIQMAALLIDGTTGMKIRAGGGVGDADEPFTLDWGTYDGGGVFTPVFSIGATDTPGGSFFGPDSSATLLTSWLVSEAHQQGLTYFPDGLTTDAARFDAELHLVNQGSPPGGQSGNLTLYAGSDGELYLYVGTAGPYKVVRVDGTGKIATAQLPAIAITDVFPVASEAAQLALTAESGDVAVRTDLSPVTSYIHNGGTSGTMSDWTELFPAITAAMVIFTPAGDLAATTVQEALEELDAEKAPASHAHATSDVVGLDTVLTALAADSHSHTNGAYLDGLAELPYLADSTATDVAGLKADFNTLVDYLRDYGHMDPTP